ncbi:hypothetical protein ACNPQM_41395 [Streptomyces sp. NPDC056231]|uniref:hypothetical protein n=1 Tax=Streptomyces sp. NPDC056231 TaxID=3345755 RepID=UPI003AAF7F8D
MVLEKVDAAALAERERIATRARSELAAAGLPVVVPGLDQIVSSGVEVSVCAFDDCSGVKVTWWCSPRLWLSAKQAVNFERPDMPLVQHHRTVVEAMTPAIRMILVSAGFEVFDGKSDHTGRSVDLLSAPEAGVPPVWWLRDDEFDGTAPAEARPSRGSES